MTSPKTSPPPAAPTPPALRKWLPVIALAAVMAIAYAMGWHRLLSFKTIGLNYDGLKAYIAANMALSLLIYVAVYVAITALSLPVGLFITIAGGLLFGWQIGAPAAVLGATIGATIVFKIVTSSLGETLARKAGPFVAKLRDGFQENALSYLLFLRLVPAFPFVVINLVPALLGVRLSTFVIGTVIGIIPGTTAYSLAGSGLGSVIEAQNASYKSCLAAAPANPETACPYSIDLTQIVTRKLIWAGIALGVVALIPVAIKFWSKRHAAA